MPTTDPRVDAYIENAAVFARPILKTLRETVHAACPSVVETIKWSMPFFVVEGRILAHMAAFQQHCAFGFWRGRGRALVEGSDEKDGMGQFGRLATPADLPPRRELIKLIQQADAVSAALEAAPAQAQAARPARTAKPPPEVPADLAAALRGNGASQQGYDKLSNSHRREYIEWIVEAKRDETRSKRLAQTLAWLAEGKSRNWKYQAC